MKKDFIFEGFVPADSNTSRWGVWSVMEVFLYHLWQCTLESAFRFKEKEKLVQGKDFY